MRGSRKRRIGAARCDPERSARIAAHGALECVHFSKHRCLCTSPRRVAVHASPPSRRVAAALRRGGRSPMRGAARVGASRCRRCKLVARDRAPPRARSRLRRAGAAGARRRCRARPVARRRRPPARGRAVGADDAARSSCAPIASKAIGEKTVEASGKVELRTRRETVLADWLHYDVDDQTIWAKGNVTLRQGIDWITGPGAQVQARHGDRLLHVAALLHRRGRRRAATPSEIRFTGPDTLRGDRRALHDVRRAAATTGTSRRASSRSTAAQGRHRARRDACYFFGRADRSTRRGSSFRCRTSASRASSRRRSARPACAASKLATPYYLNLAPNYDATLTPRLMTQARPAARRAVPLPVRRAAADRLGESRRRNPAARSRHRHRPLRAVVEAQPAVHAVARRLLEPQQGVRRHVLRRSRRPHRGHVADDAAARSRRSTPATGRGRCSRARSRSRRCRIPTAAGHAAVQPAAADPGDAARDRLAGAHVERAAAEYAQLPQAALRRPATASVLYPHGRHGSRRARRGSSPRAPACTCASTTSTQPTPRRADAHPAVYVPITSVDAGLVFERDWNVFGTRLHPDARAARVLRLHPVPQPEPAAGVRHRAGRLQFLAALHREPLPRQRPHRRRQPADAGADVAAARSATPAPSACASPSASASTSPTSA